MGEFYVQPKWWLERKDRMAEKVKGQPLSRRGQIVEYLWGTYLDATRKWVDGYPDPEVSEVERERLREDWVIGLRTLRSVIGRKIYGAQVVGRSQAYIQNLRQQGIETTFGN